MTQTPKEIIFEEEARELLLAGIKQLADVVAFTLGPRGRNVGLEKSWGAPIITNDGNSIVKEVTLKNQYENMGVAMAKEVAQKIKEKCGDGTTTGTLLLHALVEIGVKLIAAGTSPIGIKRGIDKAVDAVIKELEKAAIPVKGIEEIRNVATVSASGNREIGDLIAQAMEKAGKSGVVTIEEAKGTETVLEIVEGMQFDRGFLSTYFCTNMEKMLVEMDHPQILLIDRKISSIHEILSVLQAVAASGRELLIIAEDIDGDALSTLVVNKLRGALKVAAVKAPGFGDNRKAMMEDIAIMTGATLISEDTGISTKEIPLESLGSAAKVTISKEDTTLVNGGGDPKQIAERIKQIDREIEAVKNNYEQERFEKRKAKLLGGVVIVHVGAMTESEMKQKKQMFEDSLNATKAAIEEGIVAGGGVALLRASQAIDNLNLKGEEAVGAQVVRQACEKPLQQIAINAGLNGSVVVAEVKNSVANFGFDAQTGEIKDLVKAGVIDPAKVVKKAIMYAASVAGIVLITEALIADAVEEPEDK